MRKITRDALAVEAAICFVPASLCLFIFFRMFLIDVEYQDKEPVDRLESLLILLAGVGGILAAVALFQFIVDGRRPLPIWLLRVCTAAGLIVSGWVTVSLIWSGAPVAFVLVPAAPLLCGLHLLYLGRSYFQAASQPVEPTR